MNRLAVLISMFFFAFALGGPSAVAEGEKFSACQPETAPEDKADAIQPDNPILARCADFIGLNTVDFDSVWKGWSKAPTDLVIVGPEREYLFTNDRPPGSFKPTGYSKLYSRERIFSPAFKATFPAFTATPVIVIGAPTQADIDSKAWLATLWHEHFHQFQMSSPGYSEKVEDLGLTGGDTTGMWMLNYPFPYSDKLANAYYDVMVLGLLGAYKSIGKPDFDNAIKRYIHSKKAFAKYVGSKNYKYFEFQIWQEGLARYTELKAFQILLPPNARTGQEKPFKDLEVALQKLAIRGTLNMDKRLAFYRFGLVEGLVLDAVNPDWKKRYLSEPFQTDNYFH